MVVAAILLMRSGGQVGLGESSMGLSALAQVLCGLNGVSLAPGADRSGVPLDTWGYGPD